MPQGDWYCQRCHERGVAPPDAPKDSQLTWRTPGAHDYIRLSQMLSATVVQQPTLECCAKGSITVCLVTWHSPVLVSRLGHKCSQCMSSAGVRSHSQLWPSTAYAAPGEREYEALSTEQRGAVLGALEAVMLDTNFMRLTVAATTDTRREVAQELAALRARLRKCAGSASAGNIACHFFLPA